jgi:hypothetical protein
MTASAQEAQVMAASGHKRARFLGHYWVRPLFGRSTRLMRFMPLAQAPPYEQLMAAILREDREAALKVLSIPEVNIVEDFLCWGAAGNLVALVFDRICKLELAKNIDSLSRADGTSLLQTLRSYAALACLTYARFDELFLRLLDCLKDHRDDLVWLKGTSLSRTLYGVPHYRLSGDFDILVKSRSCEGVLVQLASLGFRPEWHDPGSCHQSGIGPTGSLKALSLAPSNEYEICHNLTLQQNDYPSIELKFDPWEQGLRAKEIDRFFADSHIVIWREHKFREPAIVDHLILELTHLHKHGFIGWQWLYDVHLLASQMKTKEQWMLFVERCRYEGLEPSAWAGLELVVDRLNTPIPPAVISQLSPKTGGSFAKLFTYTTRTEFLWNAGSLMELSLNACFLGDRARKNKVLLESLFPSRQFLSSYYWFGSQLHWWNYPLCLILHWLVLLLPGGIVRKTFGPWLWKSRSTQ